MLDDLLQNKTKQVYFCGVGKSAILASLFSASVKSIGYKSDTMSALDWSHGDIGTLDQGAKVVFLSDSGQSYELITLAKYVREKFQCEAWYYGSNVTSELAGVCHKQWIYSSEDFTTNNLGLPTFSIVAAVRLFYLELDKFIELNITQEVVAITHPNGVIGLKNRKIESIDVSQRVDNAIFTNDVTVFNMFAVIAECKSGSVVIVNEQSDVINIITDGDIRRLGDGEQLVRFAMRERKVVEATEQMSIQSVRDIMKRENISSIPVTDEKGKFLYSLNVRDLFT